jgi:hypothetical protein
MPLSDRYGRAFEHCVTEFVFSRLRELYPPGKAKMSARAKEMRHHGQAQFQNLTEEQKKQFERSGRKIAGWLVENKLKNIEEMKFEKPSGTLSGFMSKEPTSGKTDNAVLDRIPDIAGVRGDVTDIRINLFSKEGVVSVNVSLKHRHEALKHPRLTRVPEWIGLGNAKEGKLYLRTYEKIWSTFFRKGKELSANAERFRELKAINPNFVDENLYKPLYNLVAGFLRQNAVSSSQVQQMFDFMVGKFDYIKFVDHDGQIEVRDFSDILTPKSVKIEYEEGGYIYFQFDNGWRISGRLHTATQWLKKSIKFDVQPVNLDSVVPATYISTFSQTLT